MAMDRRSTLDELVLPKAPRAGETKLSLTVLWHADVGRIGRSVTLRVGSVPVPVSRLEPHFDDESPLDDLTVSRTPLNLAPAADGGVRLLPGRPGLVYEVDGARGAGGETLDAARLARGVLLGLGAGPLLWLRAGVAPGTSGRHGLVGASAPLQTVRRAIDDMALRDAPVLVLGESGTGKELVAAALHRASGRAEGPYVPINLAALPASTAPSQLFGHARGSFTGAERASGGFFGQAEGGTLFLDEIGACALDVQAQLLRALESGEVQPVGAPVRRVDVRVVAATDENLDEAVRAGTFRGALLHRLSGVVIRVPPLRDRPEDVALLAVRFLGDALAGRGRADRLHPDETPWLSRDVMRSLLAWRWPGNVRELRATCGRLADAWGDAETCGLPFSNLAPAPPESIAAPGPMPADLAALLAAHDYRVQAVADALGISVNTLRKRMADLDLPRPKDLDAGLIAGALAAAGSVTAAARVLKVSTQGLRLRMAELGMTDR
jgi:two-component system nitrogen regulation response regulator GlnG